MDDGAVLRGAVRYRRERTDGTVVDRTWQPNLVVRGCLDLVGALLCEDSDADGLRWLAVGAGDPAWDAGAPNPDPSRVALTAETARVALVPRRSLEVDIERGRVLVTARFPRGAVTGPIREVGLFGGADASVLPGSGRLVNHRVEPVVDHDEDDALHIEVELVLAEGLGAGARAVVARLLGRVPGARGITHVALGTDGRAGAAMRAEQWRRPVGAGRCRYDDRSASVVVTVRTEPGEALVGWPAQDDDDPTPRRIREVGVLGGVDEDGDSDAALLARDPVDGPRPDDPRPFEHTARLVLSARTDVRVPPLDGKTLAEAIALLHPALVLGAVRERNAGNITAGTVVEQLPEAGAEVNESTRVDLVVARLRTTRVPDVIGLDKARARRLLRDRNLDVADDAPVEVDGTGPERDVVMTCDPAPGTPVPRDTVIRLGVAVPREADVPNVRGRTRLGAEFELRRAGFVADVDDETRPSGATAGTVVAQKPKAGTRAPIDETLHLFLATPVTVEVPRVVNRDVTAAVEAIGKAGEDAAGAAFTVAAPGLSVGSVTAADSPKPPGTVTRQDPAGGEHTPLHGAVALWVAAGATVEVPDLAGMQRRAAQGALAEVGLRVGLLSTRMTGGTANTVVGQYPEPGRRLRTGLPVDLVVSKASLVPAPNLVGLLLDAAKEALEGRGLRIGQIERATGAGVRGTVTDQSPEAGELVKAGAKVALDVEDGVPGVVGLAKEAAVAILEAIGLTVT
ncbi:MAG: PASTA domain-containing protein, partial [Acidimicrobiia bacterium]|nr:PASTA domain-containing protein [Acidimicrobiia bacterium]